MKICSILSNAWFFQAPVCLFFFLPFFFCILSASFLEVHLGEKFARLFLRLLMCTALYDCFFAALLSSATILTRLSSVWFQLLPVRISLSACPGTIISPFQRMRRLVRPTTITGIGARFQNTPSARFFLPRSSHTSIRPSGFASNYYDKSVCGAVVVFDGNNNHPRRQILPMGFQNPALLDAIFALSRCHLSSFVRGWGCRAAAIRKASRRHRRITPIRTPTTIIGKGARKSSDSALHLKNTCTKLLQHQLINPVLSKQGSVSATLLFLLLYHICDMGGGCSSPILQA